MINSYEPKGKLSNVNIPVSFVNVDIPVSTASDPSHLILRPSPWLGEYVNLSPVFNVYIKVSILE